MKIHSWKMSWFLILVTLCIQGKANLTCFSSNSSGAKDISLVFDKHHDMTNLWERNTSAGALGRCDFSIFSKSSVCLWGSARPETVLLVLWNLTGSEEIKMEGENGKLFFNKIDCPRSEPISTTAAVTKPESEPNNQRGRIEIVISLGCFITVLLLLLITWLARKRQKSHQNPGDGSNGVSFGTANNSAPINTPRNGSVA